MIGRLKVEKTARYFATTEPETPVTEIWIVLHGYGQSAEKFLSKFESIESPQRNIVAPEGLHRFYTEGLSGRVGASWMTKEDRENDIEDYVNYLDELLDHLLSFQKQACRVVVVGFSQGGATATRWICQGKAQVDRLILWAASFPHDLNLPTAVESLNKVNLTLTIGEKDQFISEKHSQDLRAFLEGHGIEFSFFGFDGGHTIDSDVLNRIAGLED
jgi:predicted esterase